MLSFPDIAIWGGVALLVFGPERLPKIARQVGQAVGVVRSTANAFVREMEQAAAVPPVETPKTPASILSAEPPKSLPDA
jgi:sec-independent protein translocase protein TatB